MNNFPMHIPPLEISGAIDRKAGARYRAFIEKAARANGLPPALLANQVFRESGFKASQVKTRGLSREGSVGLMQIHPDTAQLVHDRSGLPASPLTDPATNLNLGAYRMRQMFDYAYRMYGDGNKELAYRLALLGFHWGEKRIDEFAANPVYKRYEKAYVDGVIWDFNNWGALALPGFNLGTVPWWALAFAGGLGIVYLSKRK